MHNLIRCGGGGSCTLVVLNRGNGPAAAVNAASWQIGTLNPGRGTSVSVFFSVRAPVNGRSWHSAKVTVQGIGLWGVQVWVGRQQSTFSYAHLTIYPR